jgi:hypothetical protein
MVGEENPRILEIIGSDAIQDTNLQPDAGEKDGQVKWEGNHRGAITASRPDRPQNHVRKLQDIGLERLN